MITYISILRGINVSGKKLIKMEGLRKMYENLGFCNIMTYLQSGNVIFTDKDAKGNEISETITRQIENDFGFDVPVIVMTIDTMKQIIDDNPFLKDSDKDINFLHVTFLSSKPQKYDLNIIEDKKLVGEEIFVSDNAVYLFCPNGYGQTKLTNNFLETKLKVGATTRNWKTTNHLLKIAQEIVPK
ncbi:MAG: DUF1697 domain-containing protein [Bacteroidetes bacterium]|nr:MAG: DUF1697 domain-containing protein [Bacteroidota bacterium]TAG94115.1 MAG: DUF1697 domain-containing protein [Bacteroidota bacterium]